MIHVTADDLRRQLRTEVSKRENVEAMLEAMVNDNARLRGVLKSKTHHIVRIPRPKHFVPAFVTTMAASWLACASAARRLLSWLRAGVFALWALAWPELPSHEE
jgi:hypothetical protein